MDDNTQRAFRQRIHERFADLAKQLSDRQRQLEQLEATPAKVDNDVTLLDRLPRLGGGLNDAPEALQRDLYDALRLQVIYSHRRKELHLNVTITEESAERVTDATRSKAAGFADVLRAPGGTRSRRRRLFLVSRAA